MKTTHRLLTTLLLWMAAGLCYADEPIKHEKDTVYIYTLPGCLHCKAAEDFMTKRGIRYVAVDLTSEVGSLEARIHHLPSIAPIFLYKGEIQVGFSTTKLVALIRP